MDELRQKITRSKRLPRTELELSPLAKRLQKTQTSESNKKLDEWLIKRGLIKSPDVPCKQENNYCLRPKTPKNISAKINNRNRGEKETESPSSRNVSRGQKNSKSASRKLKKTESPENISDLTRASEISNKRLYKKRPKKNNLTHSPKAAVKKQKGCENCSSSPLNKSKSPKHKEISPSNTNSKVESIKEKNGEGSKKISSSNSTNLNSKKRNIKRKEKVEKPTSSEVPESTTTSELRERIPEVSTMLDGWLRKEESTQSSKVLGRERKANEFTSESMKSSSSWIQKTRSPQPKTPKSSKEVSTAKKKETNVDSIKGKITKNSRSRGIKKDNKEKVSKTPTQKQTDLKTLFASSSKPEFKRFNSSDSCELPSFANILNNKSTKRKKVTTKEKEQKALFKKYGVNVPSIDEILKDKESLEKDKRILEEYIPMNNNFEFEPFKEPEPQQKENILHCKHLTNQQLLKSFKKNQKYLSKIISGESKNERHSKYFDKNRVITNSLADLTYNTSTILFTFDQKDFLIDLLKEVFDPEDNKTHYFFQVLLPELCLRIFMEAHKMTYNESVEHLDKQPVIEN